MDNNSSIKANNAKRTKLKSTKYNSFHIKNEEPIKIEVRNGKKSKIHEAKNKGVTS